MSHDQSNDRDLWRSSGTGYVIIMTACHRFTSAAKLCDKSGETQCFLHYEQRIWNYGQRIWNYGQRIWKGIEYSVVLPFTEGEEVQQELDTDFDTLVRKFDKLWNVLFHERTKFQKRYQKETETAETFYICLSSLAEHCDNTDTDDQIRDTTGTQTCPC